MDVQNDMFSIQVSEDGVFLVVKAPTGDATPVQVGQIVDALNTEKVEDFNRAAVEAAVRSMSGEPVKVAESQKSRPQAEISVLVSRDRMEAFLQIDLPEGARKPDAETVMEKIDKSGVLFGLLPESIDLAIRQPGLRILCAKGQAAENGQDATIEYMVDLERRGKPAETVDGGVDFKNLGLYINVEKGQVLAVKHLPGQGVEGYDVCGNSIPPRAGKDLVLHPGANVLIEEGSKLVAAVNGTVTAAGGKISVSPVLNIKSDVDLSTGNIDFAGDVVINGSVQEGFSVRAGGNVDIAGMVSGGNVKGCNVTIRQGILGLNKGLVEASGTVVAKFVENARVTADQDILINDVVLHSQLSAGKKVRVEGKRGQIVGGVTSAGDEILVKSAGSSSATPTELQAGVNPKLREAYLAMRKDLKAAETSLDQLQKGLFTLRSIDKAKLPPEKQELLLKITRAQFSTMGQVETMRKKMAELEIAYEELKGGQVKVSDYVYPGVKIVIGSLVKPISEEYRFVVFYADAGEIKFRPFK